MNNFWFDCSSLDHSASVFYSISIIIVQYPHHWLWLTFMFFLQVTDLSRPVCQIVRIKADCPIDCFIASWELLANLTDGNGTGIAGVSINSGNGSLSLTTLMSEDGTNVTVVSYNASCCSQDVELVAVDRVGNVGTCFASIRSPSSTISPSGSTSISHIQSTTAVPSESASVGPSAFASVSSSVSTSISQNQSTTAGSSASYSVSYSMCVALLGLLVSFLYGWDTLNELFQFFWIY